MKKQTTGDPKVIKKVRDFIVQHNKMVLTVIDSEGKPSSSIVHYVADDEFNFYFGTRKSFGKYNALKENSNVSAMIVQNELDPKQALGLQGVVLEREAAKLEEHLRCFVHENTSPYYIEDADDIVMYSIVPTRLRFHDAGSGELHINNIDFSLI